VAAGAVLGDFAMFLGWSALARHLQSRRRPMQAILDTMVSLPVVSLRYRVGRRPEAWVLPEGPVPESTTHDTALKHIVSLLTAWAARTGNGARISRNLAVRWLPDHPTTGIDPDVAVLLPGPVDFDDLSSYRLWEPERFPPPFAVEVVSAGHPYKDYALVHEGYAEMGVAELLVFDPLLVGPHALGGPVSLQLWQRDVSGALDRVHFGNQPVYSRVLDAWLSASGRQLDISDDRAGKQLWPTLEEAAASSAARSAAQAERARANIEIEKLEQRVRELEAHSKLAK
jgi:hypothetical protein